MASKKHKLKPLKISLVFKRQGTRAVLGLDPLLDIQRSEALLGLRLLAAGLKQKT